MASGWRQAGSPRRTQQNRCVARLSWLAVPLAVAACQRSRQPPDPAPVPAARSVSAPRVTPPANAPPPGASGAAGLPASAEPLSGDGLYLCTNKYEDQVVQRVALPTGQAFLISHGPDGWLTSEGDRLADEDLQKLERAFRDRHFFDFPEHVDTGKPAEREWDLRFASHDRAARAISYEEPVPTFREVFAACEQAFAKLPTTPSDATVALAIYRVLEEYAQGMKRPDPRRQMLIEWLDSLQADFSGP
jgi:hypothetical protein